MLSNPVPSLTFTELVGGENHTAPAGSGWQDWDISAIIPAGSKYAAIKVLNTGGSGRSAGARKNASALDRSWVFAAGKDFLFITEVDSARVIELKEDSASLYNQYSVMVYWA